MTCVRDDFRVEGVEIESVVRDVCLRRGLSVIDGHLPDNIFLPRGEFDLVIASDVVEHVQDHVEASSHTHRPACSRRCFDCHRSGLPVDVGKS
ncbi:MAG: hypothetical protein ACK54H_03870 [Phycisphaerales bacterium]